MNLHEYQAKLILAQYGISIPPYRVITSPFQALEAINELGLEEGVLKIQVHAGGRGKAGGVKIARNRQQIADFTREMLGMKIVNSQTGPQGIIAHMLLITPLLKISKEFYLAAAIDRKQAQMILIASPEGGMDIEEIALKTPHRILNFPITEEGKIRNYNLLRLTKFMGWAGKQAEQGKQIAQAIAKAFVETDASLVEINPLIQTSGGDLVALDAKFSIDDNALFRQPQIAAFYDPSQLTPEEAKAKEYDLAYVALNGNIGCMVNGAGLAMATMDIIKLCGGSPANFLDVGGGASEEKVAEGFKIILNDPKVKAILINIFGGIMNCETLAGGIVAAAEDLHVAIPLVVRMEGTNVEQGKKLLMKSGLKLIIADTLADAAQKVVAAAR